MVCIVLHLFIVDGQNLLVYVFSCFWFTSGLVMRGSWENKMGEIALVVVAQLYLRVCVLAKLCLVINCQMAIYGHPPRTGKEGDWVFLC